MHVLIIPGEELNESNQYSSVFELHQALALQKQNIHVGFISIALKGNLYNSIKNIFQELVGIWLLKICIKKMNINC